MSSGNGQVFISYHRSDLAVADRVRQFLASRSVPTWMDQYDIPSGAYWPDEIDKGLAAADVVVGLLSPDAVDSRNVKNEWDWALQNGKRLLLLLARPCVVPHRYVSINFIDASGDQIDAALESLVRTSGIGVVELAPPVPRTRYALSGGLSVAWQESGGGDIDIVYVPGFISHLEHQWRNRRMADHLRRFGTLGRLLRFDKRGTGMSDRALGIPTLEERMDDIRAVMDAAGTERAVLYGLSEGVPLSIQFAATYPERTRALILYGGSATYVTQPDYPWQKTREVWTGEIEENEANLAETWGSIADARKGLEHYSPSLADDNEFVEWFAEYMRLSASPGALIALDRMNLEVDVRSILPLIRVPTLVAHRVGERDADIGEARYIAARIPGAVLRELPGDDHWPVAGDQDSFFGAIEDFLATLRSAESTASGTDSVLATVVKIRFEEMDLMPPDAETTRLGDTWRASHVQKNGRDLVAAFDGAARAIRFAHAVLELASGTGAACRAAAHAGEVVIAERRVDGSAVEVVSGMVDLAVNGEMLATRTVRDLVAGSGIRFIEASAEQTAGILDLPLAVVDQRSVE